MNDAIMIVNRAIASAERIGIRIPYPGPAERLAITPGSLAEGLALYATVLVALFEAAMQADRTKPYAPGEPLPSGLEPEPGECWPTPREIAARVVGTS